MEDLTLFFDLTFFKSYPRTKSIIKIAYLPFFAYLLNQTTTKIFTDVLSCFEIFQLSLPITFSILDVKDPCLPVFLDQVKKPCHDSFNDVKLALPDQLALAGFVET